MPSETLGTAYRHAFSRFLAELAKHLSRLGNSRRLEGHIDVLDCYHVAGWAAYPGGIAPKLIIRVDGKEVGVTTPKYRRPDLVTLYGDNVDLGFVFSFPSPLQERAIVDVVDRSGARLFNSLQPVPPQPVNADSDEILRELSTPVPSSELIFLVNGHHDQRQFALSRRATVQKIIDLLTQVGIDYQRFEVILDFGCGCGRILAGWEHELPRGAELLGCDINAKLVAFCKANIPYARTWSSAYLPPLELKGGIVDFAYAASVFTHTTREATDKWAAEMRRIVKPGGVLMISFSGSYFEKTLEECSSEGLAALKGEGFYCFIHGGAHQTSLGSNDYATFMTPQFVSTLFEGFEVLMLYKGYDLGPTAFASYQDIAILRRLPY